jgi:hypothetical protein
MPKLYQGRANAPDARDRITVNGKVLSPRYDIRNHSPAGFAWGYSGSGPAQTALALLCDATGNVKEAEHYYQFFKEAVISRIPQEEDWEMTDSEILQYLDEIKKAKVPK